MASPLALVAEKDFAGRQAIGKRSDQEDSYAFSIIPGRPGTADGLLFIVADGMGGHAAGRRASEVVARTCVTAFHLGGGTMSERFHRAVDNANQALAEAIDSDPDHLEGMGTTLLVTAVTPLGLEWASVGDSPLYLFRRGSLRRINVDHSFRPILQAMVDKGELTAAQAASSPLRNRLRSAMIGGEIALLDRSPQPLPLLEGDVVIGGSDGLQTLTDPQLGAVLNHCASESASLIAERLVGAVEAVGAPRQDNISVGILKPGRDWLMAPFGFAPSPPSAAIDERSARETH